MNKMWGQRRGSSSIALSVFPTNHTHTPMRTGGEGGSIVILEERMMHV